MRKIILGLMGKPAAGKDTFINILQELYPEQTVANLRFSDILGEICDFLGIKKDRDGLSLVARMMKEKIAPDALAQAMKKKMATVQADFVCLNGVRWAADVDLIEDLGGYLIFIEAEAKARWHRATERGEKPGETELTFEQFLNQEDTDNDRTMDTLKDRVNMSMDNNGTRDAYRKQIADWIRQL